MKSSNFSDRANALSHFVWPIKTSAFVHFKYENNEIQASWLQDAALSDSMTNRNSLFGYCSKCMYTFSSASSRWRHPFFLCSIVLAAWYAVPIDRLGRYLFLIHFFETLLSCTLLYGMTFRSLKRNCAAGWFVFDWKFWKKIRKTVIWTCEGGEWILARLTISPQGITIFFIFYISCHNLKNCVNLPNWDSHLINVFSFR